MEVQFSLKDFKKLKIFSVILWNNSVDYLPKNNYNTCRGVHKYTYVVKVTFFLLELALLPPRAKYHLTKTTTTRYENPSFQLLRIVRETHKIYSLLPLPLVTPQR